MAMTKKQMKWERIREKMEDGIRMKEEGIRAKADGRKVAARRPSRSLRAVPTARMSAGSSSVRKMID